MNLGIIDFLQRRIYGEENAADLITTMSDENSSSNKNDDVENELSIESSIHSQEQKSDIENQSPQENTVNDKEKNDQLKKSVPGEDVEHNVDSTSNPFIPESKDMKQNVNSISNLSIPEDTHLITLGETPKNLLFEDISTAPNKDDLGVTPDVSEQKEIERDVKIIYHDQLKISIKAKYQVVKGTVTRDGFYEEYYHRGINCCGPVKLKITYIEGKKHGSEIHYNMEGKEVAIHDYHEGEYINTWYESFFGREDYKI